MEPMTRFELVTYGLQKPLLYQLSYIGTIPLWRCGQELLSVSIDLSRDPGAACKNNLEPLHLVSMALLSLVLG